jgi:hypothetical protein
MDCNAEAFHFDDHTSLARECVGKQGFCVLQGLGPVGAYSASAHQADLTPVASHKSKSICDAS